MDANAFVEKWNKSRRTEKSAANEHFLDLCELVEHPKPGDVDGKGLHFTTEKHVKKTGGGGGFADAWKKDFFAWEYKKRGADLKEALNQLLQYAGDLGNPPLMVVSDMDRIEVYTRFTGYPTTVHRLDLKTLTKPQNLNLLRNVFHNPESLRPEKTIERITEEAAKQLAEIAPSIRARHDDPTRVAHFLDRLIFCLFAEDAGLLPNKIFSTVVAKYGTRPAPAITRDIANLFAAMAVGGDFFGEEIPHFNGNLFNDASVLVLDSLELEAIYKASVLDWSEMDPSIFGTLFERVMDPAQRSQLGAHYTGYADISTLVEPVVMAPLRREWDACRAAVESLAPVPFSDDPSAPSLARPVTAKAKAEAKALLEAFLKRLRAVRILDPACGSGNFLYVTLKKLKDLELEVLIVSRRHDLGSFDLKVGPHQLFGIETNPYAFDLAQMTVWIGMIQWHRANGFPFDQRPVLSALDTFEHKDAILDLTNPDLPAEPTWPDADFIVGNPPFLGGRFVWRELGIPYGKALASIYSSRVGGKPDLCCYWFEKSRQQIEKGLCKRVGLLATQGIRGGTNRKVLENVKKSGDIFFAVADREWVLQGANVHVSLVGFDDGTESQKELNGGRVAAINADLSSDTDITVSRGLAENDALSFQGTTRRGKFDLPESSVRPMLLAPGNPNGRPNSDVLLPSLNAKAITTRDKSTWVIRYPDEMSLADASKYENPFGYIEKNVYPKRMTANQAEAKDRWWIHWRSRSELVEAIRSHKRFILTPRVSKHRVFIWQTSPSLPDDALFVFARSDDYFFGVLHSRVHEVWARSQGTQVRERESGFRYTATTCFETFPFPEPTPAQHAAISKAAKELDTLRSNWLNPREWFTTEILEFPGSVDGPWSRYVENADERGIGTVRYPRLVAKDAYAFDVKKRTLTNLYNERPTWLDHAHRALDEAVFTAYGWSPTMTDDELLAALLELNLARPHVKGGKAAAEPDEE